MTEAVVGVDGCAAGWMVALLGPQDGDLRLAVAHRPRQPDPPGRDPFGLTMAIWA